LVNEVHICKIYEFNIPVDCNSLCSTVSIDDVDTALFFQFCISLCIEFTWFVSSSSHSAQCSFFSTPFHLSMVWHWYCCHYVYDENLRPIFTDENSQKAGICRKSLVTYWLCQRLPVKFMLHH